MYLNLHAKICKILFKILERQADKLFRGNVFLDKKVMSIKANLKNTDGQTNIGKYRAIALIA